MNKKILLILTLILISGCTTTGQAIYEEPVLEGPYIVTYVVDGDTLDIGEDRIRFSGVNTPETGECFYKESTDKTTELTLNKQIYLERDISDTGKYGRKLRYIYLEDKTLLNELLVREGYAKVYDKYKDDTKRYEQLKQAESIAIDQALGVWSCIDPKEGCLYVGSKNSDKYYPPTCKWAKRILPTNLICFNSSEEVKDRILGQGC